VLLSVVPLPGLSCISSTNYQYRNSICSSNEILCKCPALSSDGFSAASRQQHLKQALPRVVESEVALQL
jgi:hypothetical protein